MATATSIHITPDAPAVVRIPRITPSAADKITSLLQENHEIHHITFDEAGRHNHIVHHLLASFSLGADAETLQKQYDQNMTYQRPPPPTDESATTSLDDPQVFKQHLESPDNYSTFLAFFTRKLSTSTIADVVNEYVFSDTELANTIFNRFFSGYYHPLIHLGYGLEFKQPAIVAEALAQACVHSGYLDGFFTLCAEAAKTATPDSMTHLLHEIQADATLHNAVKWDDGHKVRDGILARAKDEMISYASRWRVPGPPTASTLADSAAQVINAAAYFTTAAQRPPYVVKMDFFYMHAVTSSIFLSVFLDQAWIADAYKAKLIEWKGRLDLALYVSRQSPKLLSEEIKKSETIRDEPPWEVLFAQASRFMDDGHTVKFVRALKNGENACRTSSATEAPSKPDSSTNGHANGATSTTTTTTTAAAAADEYQIQPATWRHLAKMVLDSVKPESGESRWLRGTGFTEAWESVPLRKQAALPVRGKGNL